MEDAKEMDDLEPQVTNAYTRPTEEVPTSFPLCKCALHCQRTAARDDHIGVLFGRKSVTEGSSRTGRQSWMGGVSGDCTDAKILN